MQRGRNRPIRRARLSSRRRRSRSSALHQMRAFIRCIIQVDIYVHAKTHLECCRNHPVSCNRDFSPGTRWRGPAGKADPDGVTATLVNTVCASCQTLDRVKNKMGDGDAWTATVTRMQGKGAALTDAQVPLVVEYLTRAAGTLSVAAADGKGGRGGGEVAPFSAEGAGVVSASNLKVLTAQNVEITMQNITLALGVDCYFCHDVNDLSLDTKPKTLKARMMLEMARDINAKFGDGKIHVTCWTCHRASTEPQVAKQSTNWDALRRMRVLSLESRRAEIGKLICACGGDVLVTSVDAEDPFCCSGPRPLSTGPSRFAGVILIFCYSSAICRLTAPPGPDRSGARSPGCGIDDVPQNSAAACLTAGPVDRHENRETPAPGRLPTSANGPRGRAFYSARTQDSTHDKGEFVVCRATEHDLAVSEISKVLRN
jgi:hypothetical protein